MPESGTPMLAEPFSRALNGRQEVFWIKTRHTHTDRERIKSGRVSMDVAMYNSSGCNGMLAEHQRRVGKDALQRGGVLTCDLFEISM